MKLSNDSRERIILKIANLTYPATALYPRTPMALPDSAFRGKNRHAHEQLQDKLRSYSDNELEKRLVQAQAEARKRQEEKVKERAYVEALLIDAKATQDPRHDQALQKRAETVARDLTAKDGRAPSKKNVALTMASEDGAKATAATYERRFRKTW